MSDIPSLRHHDHPNEFDVNPFLSEEEIAYGQQFLTDGYIIADTESREDLDRMRSFIVKTAAQALGVSVPKDDDAFLNHFGESLGEKPLNDARLHIIRTLGATKWFRLAYFNTAKKLLNTIAGNELAMQTRVSMSIQLPGDDSSLLPVHADTWSGDSPYEVVLWIPMVDCYKTKSMFILPPKEERKLNLNFKDFADRSAEDLFDSIRDHVTWLDIPYGKVLLFSQTLMHGNIVNEEASTRWTMNCRFKGLYTPYGDMKALGEYFAPITLKPASRMAMNYNLPRGFDE